MGVAVKKRKIDFTEGPIFFKTLKFVLPLMLSGLLQQLYNMADNIVVGQFSGDDLALAAVGCTASLNAIIVNMIISIGIGSGVVIAQAFGAKDYDYLGRAVHTAVTFAAIAGVCFGTIGFALARPALVLLGTDPVILEKAMLYFRIICLGIPAVCVYNYSAAILRAVGDSRTPFIALSTSGLANVLLNLFFVIVCDMSVAGVALATVIAQYGSAAVVVATLISRHEECYALSVKKLRIHKDILIRVLKFGIPSGIQSIIIGSSNALIQSGINTFPPAAVSAKTIAANFDGIVYAMINSFNHAIISIVAQNHGANQPKRINRAIFITLLQVTVIGVIISQTVIAFAEPLSKLYVSADNAERDAILAYSVELMSATLKFYFLLGIVEVFSGTLRGLGNSLTPMIIYVTGLCGTRLVWVNYVFPLEAFNSPRGLYLVYPVSWVLSMTMMGIALFIYIKHLKRVKEKRSKLLNLQEST